MAIAKQLYARDEKGRFSRKKAGRPAVVGACRPWNEAPMRSGGGTSSGSCWQEETTIIKRPPFTHAAKARATKASFSQPRRGGKQIADDSDMEIQEGNLEGRIIIVAPGGFGQ